MRLLFALPILLTLTAVTAEAAPPKSAPVEAAPAAVKGLVFVVTVGLEDGMNLSSAFRHARVVKESGLLPEVTVVVYGRGIQVFDTGISAADGARKELDEARAAGVRIVACENSISKWGIPREVVSARAELVPAGVVEVARLVAAGHEVLSY